MNKTIINSGIAFIGTFIVLYLVACFIAWDFNPKHWEEIGRTMLGVFGLFFSLIAAACTYIENDR